MRKSLMRWTVILSGIACVLSLLACGPASGPVDSPAPSANASERILLDFENRVRIDNGLEPRAIGESQIGGLVEELRTRLVAANLYGDVDPVAVVQEMAEQIGPAIAAAGIPAAEAEAVCAQTVEAVILIVSKPEFNDSLIAYGGSAAELAQGLKDAVSDSARTAAADIGLSTAQADGIAAAIEAIDLSGTESVNGVSVTTDALGRAVLETYTGSNSGTASLAYDYSTAGRISVTGAVDAASSSAARAVTAVTYDSSGRAVEVLVRIGNPASSFTPYQAGVGYRFALSYPSATEIRCAASMVFGNMATWNLPGILSLRNIVKDERGRLSSAVFTALMDDGQEGNFPGVNVSVAYGAAVSGRRYGVSNLLKLVLGALFDDRIQEATITGSVTSGGNTSSMAVTFDALGDVIVQIGAQGMEDSARLALSLRNLAMSSESIDDGVVSLETVSFNPATTAGGDTELIAAGSENGTEAYSSRLMFDGELRMKESASTNDGVTDSTAYSYGVSAEGATWEMYSSMTRIDGALCTSGSVFDPVSGRETEYFRKTDRADNYEMFRRSTTYDSQGRVASENSTDETRYLSGGATTGGSRTTKALGSYSYGAELTTCSGTVAREEWIPDPPGFAVSKTESGVFDEWGYDLLSGTVAYASQQGVPSFYFLDAIPRSSIESADVTSAMFAADPRSKETSTSVFRNAGGDPVATLVTRWEVMSFGGDPPCVLELSKEETLAAAQTVNAGGTVVTFTRGIRSVVYDSSGYTMGNVRRYYNGATLVATCTFMYESGEVWTLP